MAATAPATTPTRLPVRFGTETVEYVLYQTTAPRAFDGFGTLTIYAQRAEGGLRYVLIDTRHLDWQVQRYHSGGVYAFGPSDDLPADDVARRLRDAMLAGLAAGE